MNAVMTDGAEGGGYGDAIGHTSPAERGDPGPHGSPDDARALFLFLPALLIPA